MQLVPGTEVAVAPKRRTNKADSFQDIKRSSDNKDQMRSKGLLRVQVQTKRISYKFELKDFDLQVVLTSAALIHPETAQNLSFDHLQLVKIFPRYSFDDDKDIISRRGSYPSEALFGGKNVGSGSTTVNLLFSSSVAKGHLMLPESVRLFLKADLCSCKFTTFSLLRCNSTLYSGVTDSVIYVMAHIVYIMLRYDIYFFISFTLCYLGLVYFWFDNPLYSPNSLLLIRGLCQRMCFRCKENRSYHDSFSMPFQVF